MFCSVQAGRRNAEKQFKRDRRLPHQHLKAIDRFQIAQATVWNLVGDDGAVVGQAATFDRWEFL